MIHRSLFVRDLRPGDHAKLLALSDDVLVISVCERAESTGVRLTVMPLSGLIDTLSLPAGDAAWLIFAETP